MRVIRDLFRLTRLACVELCVRANERAVDTARQDLHAAIIARDRARAECYDLLHAPQAEPHYLRAASDRLQRFALDAREATVRG